MSWQLHRAQVEDLESLTPLFNGYRRFYEQEGDVERDMGFVLDQEFDSYEHSF